MNDKLHWKRWAAIAAGVLAAYSLAGFWLVPAVARNQLPKFGQSELARRLSVSDLQFNPFTLRLEAKDLRLDEADGAPLLSIGTFVAQLQWRSVFRRAWSFTEVRLTSPRADLRIAPDGRFNLAQLLETLARRPREPSTNDKLPRVVIGTFALEQGRIDMRDQRAGYTNVVSPIDFRLTDFSTLPDEGDSHTFSAQGAGGGKLRWNGTATLDPIRGKGELVLENLALPELGVYLKSFTRATVAAGRLSAALPYSFSYADGKFEAALAGARVSMRDFGLAREGVSDSFASLTSLDVTGIDASLSRREVSIAQVRADGGALRIERDARGELDLAQLMVETAGAKAVPAGAPPSVHAGDWKVGIRQVVLDKLALSATDRTTAPALKVDAAVVSAQLQLAASQTRDGLQVTIGDAALTATNATIARGTSAPMKIAQLGFAQGSIDLAARRAEVGRVFAQGARLRVVRDRAGGLNLVQMLPRFDSPATTPAARPWTASIATVELDKFAADVDDEASGVKFQVADFGAKVKGASSDLSKAVKFRATLAIREGGQLAAQGSAVPGTGQVQADVKVAQLSLAPVQPLLAQHIKLKIAGGTVSARGRLTAGGGARSAALRYSGAFNVAGLVLKEDDGDLFAAWKDVRADAMTLSLAPNQLDIPELRMVEPNAKLIIEPDRSLNAARLLVKQPVAAPAPAAAPASAPTAEPFPIRVRRIRLQDAKLDFADLSLQPQFAAKMYELNGVVNGLSSSAESRSQVELDARVDEFGSARIRGELNPFAPTNNTDLAVVFKNVDLVSTSPYAMKFAGYRIAQGKISLDLQYKVRRGQLEGANQIVIDKLTLGERVDSPDALKLPLELAIAILKDSDGRIDLGLPVSGNIEDPQFSYGAIIWKAIGNVLTKIVTAPFRALGALLGGSGEELESIDFDPGSDKVLPPEREKIKQIAQILAKRPQLKISVPGHYSDADAAALRARAVRVEVSRAAGIKLEAGDEPGPLDLGSRSVRSAMRDVYARRFGDEELDKAKKAAQASASGAAGTASAPQAELPIWQRVGKMVQGEPQVADASAFYGKLRERLEANQALEADALTKLGAQRAAAIVAALRQAGVDAARATAAAPEKIVSGSGKMVALKPALGA
ncbi:DUF748 domain-containing protein [Caenimonas sp. SL110]|uniref:DUF748 domain-containing protein n=1 Tax=Caenimonas sp. SL110 TaxID=1450524 RepID=UPI0006546999|nr:DUF748 domain-containing protein [Caenimonas sp. SL110]